MNSAAYTSAAKDWWQKNSDWLGSKMNWDTFCAVWMAALNNEVSAPSASTNSAMDAIALLERCKLVVREGSLHKDICEFIERQRHQ